MGFITGLVVYLATFIRALAFSVDEPPEGPLILILVLFGIFLVTEPWVTKRLGWYPNVYLVIQSALAISTFLIPPRFDFLPILLILINFECRFILWISSGVLLDCILYPGFGLSDIGYLGRLRSKAIS